MDDNSPIPQGDPSSKKSKEKASADHLGHIVGESQEIIYEATTVFPFKLTTDTITVDREKVTVASRPFFGSVSVMSIRIADLASVVARTAPLFGMLTLASRVMIQNYPLEIRYLRREDVLNLKAILQGYIMALQGGVDCDALPLPRLKAMLYKLGRHETPNQP